VTTRRRYSAAPPCAAHHWLLEETPRAVSKGVCKRCGAEGEWSNVLPAYSFWRRYPGQRYAGERGKA